jgi:tetratricopeptide (TPR) repeat protein
VSQIAGQLAMHYAQAGLPAWAANYAEMAAGRALALAAPIEAVDLYRQALALDPTPGRQMGLGRALQQYGDWAGARAAFSSALTGFEAQGDRRGAARACLSLAETYLPVGQAGEMMRWAEQSLSYLDAQADPEAHALAHFLFGAAQLRAEHGSLAEAERHLNEAARLATENDLTGMAARSRFELGNLLAQRGDLADAVQAYLDSITLAQTAGDQWQQVLGHNNAAYHLLLMGDLAAAREHVKTGLAMAEVHALGLPLQYLHSTRGEIALAERQWDEAESWFKRGLVETEQYGNLEQAANYRANLGLVARGRGDLDGALMLLETARASAASLTAPHLQTQIDLWLAELYLQRGERTAANQALARAEARLVGGERKRLKSQMSDLKSQISN